jgi:Protein of unknown function (DUF4019)
MNQGEESHCWEGRLAPARVECHSSGGGKPPFPTLRFSTTLSLSVLIGLLILSVSIFAFACGLQTERRGLPAEVEAAVGTISDDIAAERYEKSYNEASELWRQAATLDESTATLKTLRRKLGPVEDRNLQSATEQQNSGGPLQGRAYIVSYQTKFQNGAGMETFTLVERNGHWLLARYFVNSTALK